MIIPAGSDAEWMAGSNLLLGWALMSSPAQGRDEVLPTVSWSGSILDFTRCPSSDPPHFSEEFRPFLVVVAPEYLHVCFWLHSFFLWVLLGHFNLLIFLILVCLIYMKFLWLNLSQGPSWTSSHYQLNLKRNSYELQFHCSRVWSLLIIDAIALLIIISSIKLNLHLHLCLVGCSRVWSLKGSSQIKIWYHSICKQQPF